MISLLSLPAPYRIAHDIERIAHVYHGELVFVLHMCTPVVAATEAFERFSMRLPESTR